MKSKSLRFLCVLIFGVFIIVLAGCSSGGDGDNETDIFDTHTPAPNGATEISLGTSRVTVQSDSSDSATITATVLDGNKAVAEGVTVTFSANGGQISASSVDTDENGQAEILFSCGTVDKTNQTVTITAQIEGLDAITIPIPIKGTTITLFSGETTSIAVGESPEILTVLAQDAGGSPIYDALLTLSATPAGIVSLSKDTGVTDLAGEFEVSVTGNQAGDVTITVEGLGTTATQTYTVDSSGAVFGIVSPEEDPCSLFTDQYLTITVNSPKGHNVQFATTVGLLSDDDESDQSVVTADGSDGSASAVLCSSQAGVATVQVFDATDSSITDSLTVAIATPWSGVGLISLQTSATVVAPSTGDTSNSITLFATVRDHWGDVVSGVPVVFSIEDPTAGGEYIFPVIAYTNDHGVATSRFTSGSLATDANGITVKAAVVDTEIDDDSVKIVIGGTAGSVSIGSSTKISSNETDTSYILPMSVLVADSNGNPVSGATVSLNLWPSKYHVGYWFDNGDKWVVDYTSYGNNNEDENRNLILDAGEDLNYDGELTPPNSAAGTLPTTVTTDENGVGNFNLVYLKSSAVWIEDELIASTLVWGTETVATLTFTLPYMVGEEEHLPACPYVAP